MRRPAAKALCSPSSRLTPLPTQPVNITATTVSGYTAAASVSRSPKLRQKSRLGVIAEENREALLMIYRPSKSVPGYLSCDVYRRVGQEWEFSHKHRRKYPDPPDPPEAAIGYPAESPEVWTMAPMTREELERVRELIQAK